MTVRFSEPVSRAASSTATRAYVRDVRETPLRVERDGEEYSLICYFGKSESFYLRDLTGFWVICLSARFVELIEQIRICAHGLNYENVCS